MPYLNSDCGTDLPAGYYEFMTILFSVVGPTFVQVQLGVDGEKAELLRWHRSDRETGKKWVQGPNVFTVETLP